MYELRVSSVGTRRNAAVAIGAAKELVESTIKSALDRLGEDPPRSTDGFLAIANRVRQALVARVDGTAPDSRGRHSLERLQIGLAGMLQGLDEWRNREVGF